MAAVLLPWGRGQLGHVPSFVPPFPSLCRTPDSLSCPSSSSLPAVFDFPCLPRFPCSSSGVFLCRKRGQASILLSRPPRSVHLLSMMGEATLSPTSSPHGQRRRREDALSCLHGSTLYSLRTPDITKGQVGWPRRRTQARHFSGSCAISCAPSPHESLHTTCLPSLPRVVAAAFASSASLIPTTCTSPTPIVSQVPILVIHPNPPPCAHPVWGLPQ